MSSRYSEDKLPTEERKEKEKRLETEQLRDQAEEKPRPQPKDPGMLKLTLDFMFSLLRY